VIFFCGARHNSSLLPERQPSHSQHQLPANNPPSQPVPTLTTNIYSIDLKKTRFDCVLVLVLSVLRTPRSNTFAECSLTASSSYLASTVSAPTQTIVIRSIPKSARFYCVDALVRTMPRSSLFHYVCLGKPLFQTLYESFRCKC
jgi:hypothetical protein